MELRLLGPVEVLAAGRIVNVGGPRQRSVLTALAVDAGRPVMVDTVIDRAWGQAPPTRVRHALYVYIARLRGLIAEAAASDGTPARVVRRSRGYVLDIDPERVDAHRFRRLVERARDAGSPDPKRVALLRQALGLWQGTPLADLPGDWAAQVREGWQQQRLDAVLSWAHAELRLGHASAICGPLTDLIAEYPLVEPLAAALMCALHASGRSADALDCYKRTRERLVEQLGIDPSPDLQQLHQAILRGDRTIQHGEVTILRGEVTILRGDPEPAPPTPASAPARPAYSVPAQLPPDVHGFTGRADEVGRLDAILSAAREQPTAVAILALSGTAGVGKTALAVHWAHRVADQFPDGQLYVNLRGFDPAGSAMSPVAAVRGLLDALEVPPQRIPAGLQAQVGLYRSLLADRRVLVVLDNARDADQVHPLLPGSPDCLVVVTSRNQLPGLVAAGGAHPLTLDVLSAAGARQLLSRRLGPDRVTAEPQSVDAIIERCARLPLALAIVAARAAAHPGFRLGMLAGELGDTLLSLDAFAGGDLATDLRAVFSWSYHTLSNEAARLFRLLGIHPGPDIATPAAASLAGASPARVRPLLAELALAHLVNEHAPGRFALHDLLRAYATELAHTLDADTERRAALHRVLDHYLHTAHAADRLLYPDPITEAPPRAGVTPEDLTDQAQALAWFTAEHRVLLAAIERAAATGFDTHAWQLAHTIAEFLDRRGHWLDNAVTARTALDAAGQLADRVGQAHAHRSLGRAYFRLDRDDDAQRHFQHALDLFRELADPAGQAHAHRGLARVLARPGRYRDALDHTRQALDLFRSAGHRIGEANALNAGGWYHSLLGDHERALIHCQQALVLLQEIGHRHGEAAAWDSLGYALHNLGDHRKATTCYQHSLGLCREVGDRSNEADILSHLGDTHVAAGDLGSARHVWRQALDILDDLGLPDADDVRTKLRDLDRGSSGGQPKE